MSKSFDFISLERKFQSFVIIFMLLFFIIPQITYTINNFFISLNKGDFSRDMIENKYLTKWAHENTTIISSNRATQSVLIYLYKN